MDWENFIMDQWNHRQKKKDIFMYSTYNKGPIPRYPFFLRYLVFEISCFWEIFLRYLVSEISNKKHNKWKLVFV